MKTPTKERPWFSSQFSSPRDRLWFCLFLLGFLTLPLVYDATLYDLKDLLAYPNNYNGSYHYNQRLIYNSDKPVDLLFVGGSYIRWQVNPKMVQDHFDEHFGRQTFVANLAFDMRANETVYLLLREFLKQNSANYIILTPDLAKGYGFPHLTYYQLGRYPHNAPGGLNPSEHFTLYAASIKGFVHKLRMSSLGVTRSHSDYARKYQGLKVVPPEDYEPIALKAYQGPPEGLIYSAKTKHRLHIVDYALENNDIVYFKKILNLIRSKNIPFSILLPPSSFDHTYPEYNDKVVMENDLFKEYGTDFEVLGLPMQTLFAGADDETTRTFLSGVHTNFKGANWFTQNMMGGFRHVYEKAGLR